MAFGVLLPVIRQTCALWDDQAEQLRAGGRRLEDARGAVDALGPRASVAARTYLATWCADVSRLAVAAQSRSDGLARFTFSAVGFDDAAAEDLRAVLPWDGRFAAFVLPTGRPAGP